MFDPDPDSQGSFGKQIRWAQDLWIGLTTGALRRSARRARQEYVGTLIGITGSAGKTTTTHVLASLLTPFGSVRARVGSNTQYQVLRTLRHVHAPTDFVVQEVSGHAPGHIAKITDVLPFDISVVTAVGGDHLGAFRSLDGVAEEKSTLVRTMRPTGIACLNADDPRVAAMAAMAPGRVITFGRTEGATLRATDVDAAWPHTLNFTLELDGRRLPVRTRLVTSLYLPSVLAALAVVKAADLDMERALDVLASVAPVRNRMEPYHGSDGHTYLSDVIKAPLWSTQLLAERISELAAPNLVVVLGEVSDCGNDASRRYRRLLRTLSETANLVIGTGPAARHAARLAEKGGGNIMAAENPADVPALLRDLPPSLVLLKGNGRVNLAIIYQAATA